MKSAVTRNCGFIMICGRREPVTAIQHNRIKSPYLSEAATPGSARYDVRNSVLLISRIVYMYLFAREYNLADSHNSDPMVPRNALWLLINFSPSPLLPPLFRLCCCYSPCRTWPVLGLCSKTSCIVMLGIGGAVYKCQSRDCDTKSFLAMR